MGAVQTLPAQQRPRSVDPTGSASLVEDPWLARWASTSNRTLAGDTVIDGETPEVVIYEEKQDDRLALVGVEYVVFQSACDAEHHTQPELFGQEFRLVAEPNRYGIPAFYELHAWAWKDNPTAPTRTGTRPFSASTPTSDPAPPATPVWA